MRKLLFLAVAMTMSLTAMAQSLQPVPMDSAVRYGKLPNGLTYYIRHNEKPKEKCEFFITQAVGAVLEEDHQNGLAHFLEHMCFNGTEHFPDNAIDDYFEKQGCRTNAYTSYDETVYEIFAVPTKREGILDTALLVLRDWSCAVTLSDEEIDKERGVIREEWRTGNTSYSRMYNAMMKIIFPGTQYAKRDVIGDTAVINNFSYQALRDYYHRWYGPDLQAVMIVGDIDVDVMEEKVIRMFSDVKPREGMTPRPRYGAKDNEKPDVGVYLDHEAQYQSIMVGYKYPAPTMEYRLSIECYIEEMFRDLYVYAINDRFADLAAKPESNFTELYVYYGNQAGETDVFCFMVTPKDGKESAAYRDMCREIERIRRYGITASELERVKAKQLSRLEKSFNERDNQQNGDLMYGFINHFLTHYGNNLTSPYFDLQTARALLPEIDYKRLNELFTPLISDRNMFIAGIGKDKKDANGAGCNECAMPTEEQLLAIYNETKNQTIDAPKEETIDRPLVRKEPKAGKVIATSHNDELEATELTLSNGVKVVIKTTDFSSDEIQMSAKSHGGTAYYESKDMVNAEMAASVVKKNGVGTFNSVELDKVLAGKRAFVSPYINRESEEMSGSSTVKDFETMLKLNYLYFTEPRLDDNMFATLQNELMERYSSRDSDPETAFYDHITKLAYNNSERALIWDTSLVRKIDQKRAIAIYRERFSNPADFTFYFVGNINVNDTATIALIEKWIGGMKTSRKFEKQMDDKMYYAKGGNYDYFKRTMETKTASTFLQLTGTDFEMSAENKVRAKILGYILYTRYYESIREREGGTYGVSANGGMSNYPENTMEISIFFDTDPDKQNHLLNIIYDEMETIIKEGPKESDLTKAKEIFSERLKTQVQENYYWADVVFNWYHFDGIKLQDYQKALSAVTGQEIQETLKKIYEQNNRIEVVMMPTR